MSTNKRQKFEYLERGNRNETIETLLSNTPATTVSASDGTVSAPSMAFSNDTDTGLYRIGANNLGVSAGATKILDISSTGMGVTGKITVGDGSASVPSIAFSSDTDTGFYRVSSNHIGVSNGGSLTTSFASYGVNSPAFLVSNTGTPSSPAFYLNVQTGLYSAGSGLVDVSCSSTKIAEFSTSGVSITGNVTHSGTAPVGLNWIRIERGNRTSGTSFTSTERCLGLNVSAAFSGTVDLTGTTLDTTTITQCEMVFKFINAPTLINLDVRAMFAASPSSFTITIRKASDGSSVETFTQSTTVGGNWSFTPTPANYAANTYYYFTWKNTNSVNTSPWIVLTYLS